MNEFFNSFFRGWHIRWNENRNIIWIFIDKELHFSPSIQIELLKRLEFLLKSPYPFIEARLIINRKAPVLVINTHARDISFYFAYLKLFKVIDLFKTPNDLKSMLSTDELKRILRINKNEDLNKIRNNWIKFLIYQRGNRWKTTEEGRYIKSCFNITELRHLEAFEISLTPNILNITLLNQLFSFFHDHGIEAVRKSDLGLKIYIPFQKEEWRAVDIKKVEYAINDFAAQDQKLYPNVNNQMEEYIWCVSCHNSFKSNKFSYKDINNSNGLFCDVCWTRDWSLEGSEKIESDEEKNEYYDSAEMDLSEQ